MPLYVLNVAYPLIEEELIAFCAGKSAVIVVEEGGREVTVRTVLPGAAIGEMGLFRQLPRSATARADLPTEVLRMTQLQLRQLQAEKPALAAELYRLFVLQMASRLDQLTAQATQLAR